MSACPALVILACADNSLAALDVTACTGLTILLCGGNEIATLDVRPCAALTAVFEEGTASRQGSTITMTYADGRAENTLSFDTSVLLLASTAVPFEDVSSAASYYSAVVWAYDSGIVRGTSATTFSPRESCTRGQLALMLYRMAGKPSVIGIANPFDDVKPSAPYYEAVLWAYSAGIIRGTGEAHFNPNGSVTRSQIVLMLYRMAGRPDVSDVENPFTDVEESDSFFRAVLWAYSEGVTTGTSAATFSPADNCTRFQLVMFLYRFHNITNPTPVEEPM